MKKAKRAGALRMAIMALAVISIGMAVHAQEDAPAATNGPAMAGGAADAQTSPSGPIGDRKITVVSMGFTIDRIVAKFAEQGVTVAARGKVAGQKIPSYIVRNAPIKDALVQLVNSQPNWLLFEPTDRPGTFEIWDQESYRTEVLPRMVRQKTFLPREITAEEAYKAIQGVITPTIGTAAYDPRSNKVFVTDLLPVLELVQRLIEQIDVKFLTRVFLIHHADINSIAEKLGNMKSPAATAPEVDERTRQIIVRDRLDVLRQMDLMVETLDIGPDLRVYDLNNMGIQGDEIDQIEEAISEVITEGALFKINIRQSRMILRDVPDVHDQVEKILAAFDQPIRQVLLQAEIIETEFSEGFNYSVDYAFSRDLFAAVTDKLTGTLVPTGSGVTPGTGTTPGTGDADTLGFINFRKEFPIIQGGSSGINAQFLSKYAFIKLQAAMSDSRTRVLQQPRVLVENQKTATFVVGQKIPFFTGGSIGSVNSGNNQVLTPSQPVQQLLTVGLDLEITPVIANNGLVEMEVSVRNNTPLFTTVRFAGQDYTGVGSNNQEIETTLLIPSGETRVIGGLVADSKSEQRSGIPGLYRIPVIGPALFGSLNKPANDNRRRNLLIFLTPTIVQEKAGDLLKYKGRVMQDVAEELTTPTATLSDYDVASLLPPDKTSYGSLRDQSTPPPLLPLDLGTPGETNGVPAVELPPVETAPPAEELHPLRSAIPDPYSVGTGEMAELKKISIDSSKFTTTDSLRSLLPRIPAPSGALGGTVGTGAKTAGTGTAPAPGTVPGAAGARPAPSVATPGVFQPPATATTIITSPVVTPAPAATAPPTETRIR
ncbi:MAG: hypothetical protein ACR2IE_08150 [Candidatus Sumerlaeaceae bacterium]